MERINTFVWEHYSIDDRPIHKGPIHLLVFPKHLDLVEMQEAIKDIKPIAVIPPWSEDPTVTLAVASVVRQTGAPIGVVAPGRYNDIVRFMHEAVSQDYTPIVIPGHNSHQLWNLAQQRAFVSNGWYHYLTNNEPYDNIMPGRWTWGLDFVGALNGGSKV